MKNFRLLKADEIECRVSTITVNGVKLWLYKTARTDADILDETFGAHRWENDFKLVDGVLYGGIGIDYANDGKLVWKWDAGTESNTEAEKGRASDAFKRAGFKHGIGRELYSAPFIWIKASDCKIEKNERGKFECKTDFDVSDIAYDAAERISSLTIVNAKSRDIVYRFGSSADKNAASVFDGVNPEPTTRSYEEPSELPPDMYFRCADCGNAINDTTWSGKRLGLREWCEKSTKKYGRQLCKDCLKKASGK